MSEWWPKQPVTFNLSIIFECTDNIYMPETGNLHLGSVFQADGNVLPDVPT